MNKQSVMNPELANHQLALSTLQIKQRIFYETFLDHEEDHGLELVQHVAECAEEMDRTPWDAVDKAIYVFKKSAIEDQGVVDRRGPKNPFRSKKFNKKKYNQKEKKDKTVDPAMEKIPLRGRLIVNIATCSLLLWVFLQELVYSKTMYGQAYDPANGNYGPSGTVLNDLGALNGNAIREGQVYRIFWACYMHSGWMHIGMNLLCQVQYIVMYEPDWGFWRTLSLFFGAALCGNLLSVNLDPCMITVGSSGALFGLMGACLPYCLEYWTSLPRPWMIAVMTIIIMTITVLMGFGESGTDNWAHIGGGVAGLLIGFMGTVNLQKAPACCKKKKSLDDQPKEIKKNVIIRFLQSFNMFQGCKCGWREWALRLFGFFGFGAFVGTGFYFLLVNPKFQPMGSMTWDGVVPCCCCIPTFYQPISISQDRELVNGMVDNRHMKNVRCGKCVSEEDGMRMFGEAGGTYPANLEYPLFEPNDVTTWKNIHKRYPCAWVTNPRAHEQHWDEWDPTTWAMPEGRLKSLKSGAGSQDGSRTAELRKLERQIAQLVTP